MSLFSRIAERLGFGKKESAAQPEQDLSTTPMSSGSYLSGSNVNSHFDNAIKHAQDNGRPVYADVNGIKGMLVDPQSTTEGLMETYKAAQTARTAGDEAGMRNVLQTSPEAQRLSSATNQKYQTQNAEQQRQMDGLMQSLPTQAHSGPEAALAWVAGFSRIADNNSITFDRAKVEQNFAGFSGGDSKLGRSADQVVGAMLGQMRDVGVPHPSLENHANKALEQKPLSSLSASTLSTARDLGASARNPQEMTSTNAKVTEQTKGQSR